MVSVYLIVQVTGGRGKPLNPFVNKQFKTKEMGTKILINQFTKFAEAAKLKIEQSHFECSYDSDSKYIIAQPGSIYLQFADPRIGKRAAVYLNLNKDGNPQRTVYISNGVSDVNNICEVFGKTLDEATANAKLICAAKELLKVCSMTLQDLESDSIFETADTKEYAILNLKNAINQVTL